MSSPTRAHKPADRAPSTRDDGSLDAAIDEVQRIPAEEQAPLAAQVSADWGAEREADRVADDAVQRFDGPALDGDRLSGGLQAAMTAAEPKLGGLGDVRFDQSAAASSAADSIDALAFTTGTDVAVARGEMTPHLAAHEATHAVQHAGDGMVHAKLRGTRQALEQLGGGETTEGLRKKIGAKTNWDKIVEGVGAYEGLEDALLTGGNPSTEVLSRAKPKMAKVLKGVQGDIKAWQKANDQKGEDKKSQSWTKKLSETGERQMTDDRSKAERRQAVAMLSPRINNEMNMLQSEDSKAWLGSLGLSSDKIVSRGGEKGGQKNSVKELTYQTEQGEFSGYFKEEKGFAKDMEAHEADVGIQMADPNYGARSVAMYKLDQLFSAGVTARAEFATHVTNDGKTVMGTVLESAKGSSGAETKIAFTKEQAKAMGPGTIALTDPVLQRSLNKLQWFDAICGQLDRHDGNYHIQVDENGNVTGVTGIDLDMAFGGEHDDDKKAKAAPNYKGTPEKIDEEFAERILQVSSKDIADALRGLLPDKEIQATLKRFENVKNLVLGLKKSESLVKQWNDDTAIREGLTGNDVQFIFGKKTYQDSMGHGALIHTKKQMHDAILDALSTGYGPRPFNASLYTLEMESLPDAVKSDLAGGAAHEFSDLMGKMVFDLRLGDQAEELAMLVCNEMLRDHAEMSKIAVYAQTAKLGDPKGFANQTLNAPAKAKWIPAAQQKLSKPKVKPKEQEQEGGGRRSLIGSRGRR